MAGFNICTTCEGCKTNVTDVNNFWLLPWCFSCGPTRLGLKSSNESINEWLAYSSTVRNYTLNQNTVDRYTSLVRRSTDWLLDKPIKVIRFLKKCSNSKASLKQATVAMIRVHRTRGWNPPPLNRSLIKDLISALFRIPTNTQTTPKPTKVFTNTEVINMFEKFSQRKSVTDARDAAILALQLFGGRRAGEILNLELNDLTPTRDGVQIRIKKSKTDQRGEGLFFDLPGNTALGINPQKIPADYIRGRPNKFQQLFTTFNSKSKQFTTKKLSVQTWNKSIKRCLMGINRPYRSSHAIRSTAISLAPQHSLHTIAKVGRLEITNKHIQQIYKTDYKSSSSKNRRTPTARFGRGGVTTTCTTFWKQFKLT